MFLKEFILLLLISTSLYANPKNDCDITGKWWDNRGVWDFTQNNTIVSGYDWNQIEGICAGRYPLSGTIIDDHLSFRTQNPKPSEKCADWFDYTASISSDCKIITGTWVNNKEKSGTFQLERNPKPLLKIISPAKNHSPFLIDENEKMPIIPFVVQIVKRFPDPTSDTEFTWSHTITQQVTPKQIYSATWKEKLTGKDHTPLFDSFLTDGLYGGEFKVKTEADIDGVHISDERKHKIYGTNPGKERIDAELTKKAGIIPLYVLQGIVCQESKYRQFAGKREGGTGIPIFGDKIRNRRAIGMMQLYKPAPLNNAIWSWRNNLNAGIEILTDKIPEAKELPKNERIRLNKRRKEAGLSPCPKGYPTPLNEKQMIREVIRRFNGGREHQWEPWDSPHCEEGHWEIDPVRADDIEYVDNVLACQLNNIDYWNNSWVKTE